MRTKCTIDAADAAGICQNCLAVSSSVGASVSIAIVDEGGNLLHFARMDRVGSHTIDFAMRKARSAATTGVSSKMVDAAIGAGKVTSVDAIGWGGVPLHANGECVGAIGISGSSVQMDEEIAQRAAQMFAEQQGGGALAHA